MRRALGGSVCAAALCAVVACAASTEAVGEVQEPQEESRAERIEAARKRREANQRERAPLPGRGKYDPPPGGRDSWNLTPLTELDGAYKGQTGGLYGDSRNEPPEALRKYAAAQLEQIVPRDRTGRPARDGKVVMVSIGMSNTHAEFVAFQKLAKTRKDLSRHLVLVDGAQGGNDARHWADPDHINQRTDFGLWERVDQVLKSARVTPAQVQVAWINLVIAHPERLGEFPVHARELRDRMVGVLHLLESHYPNVKLAFLSSRVYAGYSTATLSPEPYAYEAAFTMRWLIESQQEGDPELNWLPERGAVLSPLLLWGPYLWADGMTPRADGLVWERKDFNRDGVHPNDSGERKVAELLMRFFTTDPFARPWFLAEPPGSR